MPRCDFRIQALGHFQAAAFPTPRKVSSLDAWLLDACKALGGEEPVPAKRVRGHVQYQGGWYETHRSVDEKFIRFDFVNKIGIRSLIIIDRRYRQFGQRI